MLFAERFVSGAVITSESLFCIERSYIEMNKMSKLDGEGSLAFRTLSLFSLFLNDNMVFAFMPRI